MKQKKLRMVSEDVGNTRLLELASLLESLDVHYDQRDFYKTILWCRTPSCALGHWADAHRDRWEVIRGIPYLRMLPHRRSAYEHARYEFHLSYSEVGELFTYDGCDEARSAKAAAAYIRKFVENRTRQKVETDKIITLDTV